MKIYIVECRSLKITSIWGISNSFSIRDDGTCYKKAITFSDLELVIDHFKQNPSIYKVVLIE
jgi:hypothetical protein